MNASDLSPFARQYVETALWSTNDESTPSGGDPLDWKFTADDIHPDTLARMQADCDLFERIAGAIFRQCCPNGIYEPDPEVYGHDFWLTRNGHGAGFWDGDWVEPLASQLTELSKEFGEYSLTVDWDEDGGVIHGYGPRIPPGLYERPTSDFLNS